MAEVVAQDSGRYSEVDIEAPDDELDAICEGIEFPQGLIEVIHVRFFPKNIVGFDSNFYGPRLPRLGRYINRVAPGVGRKVNFNPLLRRDALNELTGKDLRVFSMRIKSSEIETVKKADKSLGSAFEATDEVSQADEVQVILRPKRYSRGNLEAIDHGSCAGQKRCICEDRGRL